jgi:hypothetical protein
MRRALSIATLMFGVFVAFAGNGLLTLAPHFTLREPKLSWALLGPLVAFGLLSVLIGGRYRFVSTSVVAWGTGTLSIVYAILLSPLVIGTASTDAQAGLLEYALCLAALPVATAIAVVSIVTRLVQKSAPVRLG